MKLWIIYVYQVFAFLKTLENDLLKDYIYKIYIVRPHSAVEFL
jgi:hypothetical protein